jgi:hypothetical protein
MGAVYKRKRRSCGLCKPSKRGLAKRERKGKGTKWFTRQDERWATKRALAEAADLYSNAGDFRRVLAASS